MKYIKIGSDRCYRYAKELWKSDVLVGRLKSEVWLKLELVLDISWFQRKQLTKNFEKKLLGGLNLEPEVWEKFQPTHGGIGNKRYWAGVEIKPYEGG